MKFCKVPRTPDYFLNWTGSSLRCRTFFAVCMGSPLLTIEKKDFYGETVSRVVHTLELKELRERGMVEESTTAAERRRAEHGGGK